MVQQEAMFGTVVGVFWFRSISLGRDWFS